MKRRQLLKALAVGVAAASGVACRPAGAMPTVVYAPLYHPLGFSMNNVYTMDIGSSPQADPHYVPFRIEPAQIEEFYKVMGEANSPFPGRLSPIMLESEAHNDQQS